MLSKVFRDFRLAGGAKEETETGNLFNTLLCITSREGV